MGPEPNDPEMGEGVLIETIGATRIVTMDRPRVRNALTLPVLARLAGALDGSSCDEAIRCVVLTGSGGHFCAGADLRQSIMEDPRMMDHLEEYMDAFHSLIKSVIHCRKPTIAMMDGAAVGFGADLAFACDLRVASARAYVQEKFVRIGLMPDGGGTFWLPRLIGTARAMQMILLAEKMDASELHRLGVIAKLVEPEALRQAAIEMARMIESGPPLAYAAIKRVIYANSAGIEDALVRERAEQLKLLRSADVIEGVTAWAEKRTPHFEGR